VHEIDYKGMPAYLGIAYDVTQLLQLQEQLSDEKISRQKEITRATIDGQEKERKEIARELHDNINQILATSKLYLDSIISDPQNYSQFLPKSRDLVMYGIGEIRKLSKSLLPPSLGELSLKEALYELIMPIKSTKKQIRLRTKGLAEDKLCDGLKLSVYRITQEALNNTLKYADANEITISVIQQKDELVLEIADNGKGFDINKKRKGIGINNMMNRASTFNGVVEIDSSPGNGCRLTVSFSLKDIQKKELVTVTER